MLAILREISIACFFTNYLVVLVLELLRLAGRIPGRGLLVIVMMVLGLFTHTCYLLLQATAGEIQGGENEIGLWATWSDWSLLVALGLAVCFFVAYLRRPDTIVSFFFLPAVLAMIGFAIAVSDLAPFSRNEAVEVWRRVHALAMMIGSGAVLTGFIAGVMYLVQSRRLKKKRAGSAFRLPTLESLGRLNRRCLIISTSAVGLGLLAGIVMNLNQWGQVGLSDRGVLFSLLLLLWLCGATCLDYFYEPASHGRKAVYLTLASLGFLILAMIGVLTAPHGQNPDEQSKLHTPSTTQVALLSRNTNQTANLSNDYASGSMPAKRLPKLQGANE
ncbi:MAG: cytochrome c biogenesis protein CcsA [Rubripirellula sp.]|nr:cytochrome c biogenesis protein CcsA [Rubripirellula sp.]